MRRLLAILACLSPALLTGCGPFGCIREGELIALVDGDVPVEQVRVGDQVRTATGTGTVVAITPHRATETCVLRLSGGNCLRVTSSHPLATAGVWMEAGLVTPGMVLETAHSPET